MSAYMLEDRRIVTPKQFHVPRAVTDGRNRRERVYNIPLPCDATDEELQFVTRVAIWMAVLGVTPLILFLIFNSFYPNSLLIPITPN